MATNVLHINKKEGKWKGLDKDYLNRTFVFVIESLIYTKKTGHYS